MFRKNWHPTLTKAEISRLRGGKKHDFHYFVGILETAESTVFTDILEGKLRNQMASQRSPGFPDGYELFQTCFGTAKLCLKTMTVPVPRLKLYTGWPNPQIDKKSMLACVLHPSRDTEAFQALKAEAEVFTTKCRIRRHATESRTKFDLVLSLLAYEARIPLITDPAERFEAYLSLRSPEFLRDLLALLDMPDVLRKPAEPDLLRAA